MTAILALYDAETKRGAIAADGRMSGPVKALSGPKIKQLGVAFVASAGAMAGSRFLDQYSTCLLNEAEVDIFASEWRKWCTDLDCYSDDEGQRSYPAMFVILAPHGLYEILPDGGVYRHQPETRAASIGSGTHVCMGAAAVMLRETVDYGHIAKRSVEAAIDLLDSCGGPVQVCTMYI